MRVPGRLRDRKPVKNRFPLPVDLTSVNVQPGRVATISVYRTAEAEGGSHGCISR